MANEELSRRKALARISALALGAYAAPSFTTLSIAHASEGSTSSGGSEGSESSASEDSESSASSESSVSSESEASCTEVGDDGFCGDSA